ncbi:hypothetical protein CY35_16G020400 [Sphagnum magellanicum]|jgi:hypothetical protein|nr:hypothetical protein CY35_16G020400 [Sphagnum magellanicum]
MAEREQDLGLSCNAFNTYRALQNLEVLKAGQGEVLKALQANIIPTYSWVAFGETMIAQIGWQSRHRVMCYLSMLSTLPMPSKTFSVESRAQDVLKAVQHNITPIHIHQFAVAVGDLREYSQDLWLLCNAFNTSSFFNTSHALQNWKG